MSIPKAYLLPLLSLLFLLSFLQCTFAADGSFAAGPRDADLPFEEVKTQQPTENRGTDSVQIVTDATRWLHEAIRRSSSREIQAAINEGAELTEECLWLAAVHTDSGILDYLLKQAGLSVQAKFTLGALPGPGQDTSELGSALRRRLLGLFTSDGHQTEYLQGVTLLHFAALVGNTDTARYLLHAKADPNAAMNNGQTPMLVGFSAWLHTWNPMHVTPTAIKHISKTSNYPGFIYTLLDHGARYEQLENLLEKKRDVLERYVVSLAQNFSVPMKDGSLKTLESLLEGLCTNTAWGLLDQHLFVREYPNYCNIKVIFLGRLKSDGTSICFPFGFVDDRFVMPGDSAARDVIIWHNGKTYSSVESLRFLDSMGIDLGKKDFWDNMDAQFEPF